MTNTQKDESTQKRLSSNYKDAFCFANRICLLIRALLIHFVFSHFSNNECPQITELVCQRFRILFFNKIVIVILY